MSSTVLCPTTGGATAVADEKESRRGYQISVVFRQHDLEDLKAVAEETDTPIATLVRQWTLERLRQIKPLRRGRDCEGQQ